MAFMIWVVFMIGGLPLSVIVFATSPDKVNEVSLAA